MPKKGDVIELVWVCPNCTGVNPGLKKTCESCGAPQPDNVEFLMPDEIVLLTGSKKAEAAKAKADIHCGFCGTRNVATNTVCTQCGADLKEGKVRKHGHEVGSGSRSAASTYHGNVDPVTGGTSAPAPLPKQVRSRSYPAYQEIPPNKIRDFFASTTNHKYFPYAIGTIVVLILGWLFWMVVINTTPENVTITRFQWSCTTNVDVYDWVEKTDQSTSPPSGARNIVETQEITGYGKKESCGPGGTELQPTGNKIECNGKWIDRGNGVAEWVTEECDEMESVPVTACSPVDDLTKPTKEPRWSYEIEEWSHDYSVNNSGTDQNPVCPIVTLDSNQRLASPDQVYTVYYTDQKGKEHSTFNIFGDIAWFQSFYKDQICIAQRNGIGGLNPGIDCSAAVNP